MNKYFAYWLTSEPRHTKPKDASLADLDNLPDPDILAQDIIENIQSALANFAAIYSDRR